MPVAVAVQHVGTEQEQLAPWVYGSFAAVMMANTACVMLNSAA
jgi:hypothetical protein